jgi:hypothetical protein
MKKLINTVQEKWAEYVLEIIVIVLSIFGGLELENWNSQRIEKRKEIEILADLSAELRSDLAFNQWAQGINNDSRNSMKIIRESLEGDLPYNDSLNLHFSQSTYTYYSRLNGSVFETIKSVGLDIISNKNLRDSIVYVYGWYSEYLNNTKANYEGFMMAAAKNVFNTRFDEFWHADIDGLRYTDISQGTGEMVPVDYESLKTDQEYLYILKSLPNVNYHYIDYPTRKCIMNINMLLNLIDKELSE